MVRRVDRVMTVIKTEVFSIPHLSWKQRTQSTMPGPRWGSSRVIGRQREQTKCEQEPVLRFPWESQGKAGWAGLGLASWSDSSGPYGGRALSLLVWYVVRGDEDTGIGSQRGRAQEKRWLGVWASDWLVFER